MTPAYGKVLTLDTLARVRRELNAPARAARRLHVPEGMNAPLGCDAVSAPARYGPLILPRLPRTGCVFADETHWWWLVPSDSDYALEWPAPARYATGAVVPDAPVAPHLIHRPEGDVPYTPPIPLYLALCRVIGIPPVWTRPVIA